LVVVLLLTDEAVNVDRLGDGERVIDLSEGADESIFCNDSKSFEWALPQKLKKYE